MAHRRSPKNDDCKPRPKKCDRKRGHGHDEGGKKKCHTQSKPWRGPVRHGRCDKD